MAQFDIYENPNTADHPLIPYLLDIQSNNLSELSSRVVVPLYAPTSIEGRITERLVPVVRVRGSTYRAMMPELAGVSLAKLGPRVGSLASVRGDIIAALDLLITGI